MAEQQQDIQFSYCRVELYKSESLGSGSYGGVCRAKCDGLPCAAKIMHSTLFDLRDPGEGRERQWCEVFPPMPTPRGFTVSVTTEQALVVAGGYNGSKYLDKVEVMNIPTKQWSTARHLPHPFIGISATICGDQLYLGGGCGEGGEPSKSVLTCFLPGLLRLQSLGAKLRTLFLANDPGVWRYIEELPATLSTLTTLVGHLVAIGGADNSDKPTADIHYYDRQTDSWHIITRMKTKRCRSLVAVLPEDRLIIVGGCQTSYQPTDSDSVEIGSVHFS